MQGCVGLQLQISSDSQRPAKPRRLHFFACAGPLLLPTVVDCSLEVEAVSRMLPSKNCDECETPTKVGLRTNADLETGTTPWFGKEGSMSASLPASIARMATPSKTPWKLSGQAQVGNFAQQFAAIVDRCDTATRLTKVALCAP